MAITSRSASRLVDALLELGVVRRRLDRESLRRDLEHLLSRYYGRPLGELALGPMIEDALAVVRRHHLHLPPTLALLLKTIVMNEGLGVRLDPDFKVTTVLPDYARRMMLRQYSPGLWARRLGQAGLDAALLGVELPQRLHRIMGDLERGSLEVGMRPTGFESIVRSFERLANRLVLSIIAAALINGLAILMSVYHPPGWQEWAGTLFAVGFLFALLLGAFLLWSTFRPGGE